MKNDPRSYDRNFCNCVKKPEKNSGLQRGLNPWPMSYEATDVGSRWILGSYVPVKDMKVNDAYEINHMWTADMKSNEEWSSQLWSQFLQLRKEAWKKNSGLQRGLNPWPRDTGATLYQLSYEATDVGSRWILGSYVPVIIIYMFLTFISLSISWVTWLFSFPFVSSSWFCYFKYC